MTHCTSKASSLPFHPPSAPREHMQILILFFCHIFVKFEETFLNSTSGRSLLYESYTGLGLRANLLEYLPSAWCVTAQADISSVTHWMRSGVPSLASDGMNKDKMRISRYRRQVGRQKVIIVKSVHQRWCQAAKNGSAACEYQKKKRTTSSPLHQTCSNSLQPHKKCEFRIRSCQIRTKLSGINYKIRMLV